MVCLVPVYYGVPGLSIAYAIRSAALILGLAWTPNLFTTRWLATRPMIVLGEASYAFYLIHMTIGADLTLGLLTNGFASKKQVLLWIVGVVFVTATAIGLNIMVETPARRFIRRWLSPRKRDSGAAGAVLPPLQETRADRSAPAGPGLDGSDGTVRVGAQPVAERRG